MEDIIIEIIANATLIDILLAISAETANLNLRKLEGELKQFIQSTCGDYEYDKTISLDDYVADVDDSNLTISASLRIN